MENIRRVSLSIRTREYTKEDERNDKTIKQVVSFDLPPVFGNCHGISSYNEVRLVLLETQLRTRISRLARTARRRGKKGQRYREIPARVQSPAGYGAALKNPLESARGKGERAGGAPAAIGHSAIFAGIHASVSRAVFIGKVFSPSPVICIYTRALGESRSGSIAISGTRASDRGDPGTSDPLVADATRPAAL